MDHVHNIRKFFSNFLPNISTKNFNEAGHGKDTPNGMGTTLKQIAGRIVREGHDIENFEKLMCVLKIKCTGVKLTEFISEEISEIGNLLNNRKINTFIRTQKVHQITYSSGVEYFF